MSSGSGEGTGYHLAYTGTMLFICTVAVVLNILVIGIIFKSGRFRTSVDIFVTNLAVSDILQAGVVLPIHFSDLTGNTHDFAGGKSSQQAHKVETTSIHCLDVESVLFHNKFEQCKFNVDSTP